MAANNNPGRPVEKIPTKAGCYIGGRWHSNMEVFDRLPKPARDILNNSWYRWSSASLWLLLYTTQNSKRRRWSLDEVVAFVDAKDIDRAAKAYIRMENDQCAVATTAASLRVSSGSGC